MFTQILSIRDIRNIRRPVKIICMMLLELKQKGTREKGVGVGMYYFCEASLRRLLREQVASTVTELMTSFLQ